MNQSSDVINGIDLTQHLGLIGLVVQRSAWAIGASLEREDLFNAGFFGLRRAAELYDPELGYRFGTYAMHWIRHHVSRAVADQRRTVRIPVWFQESSRRGVRKMPPDSISLDAPIRGDDTTRTILDMLASEEDATAELDARERREAVEAALATLPERLRGVLVARFWQGETLAQIGRRLNLSRERVRQLERDALERLRGSLAEAS